MRKQKSNKQTASKAKATKKREAKIRAAKNAPGVHPKKRQEGLSHESVMELREMIQAINKDKAAHAAAETNISKPYNHINAPWAQKSQTIKERFIEVAQWVIKV